MNHYEKIEFLLDDLSRRGISKYTIGPPLYRLLWRLGLEIKPPFFAGFWALTIFMDLFFGIFWGALMWLLLWHGQGIPIGAVAAASAIAGLCFGLSMACYYRWRSRKLLLPSWEDYPSRPS